METILKAYGIWETIIAKEGEETNEKKEKTSMAMIFQTLPQDVLMQVAQYSTAKEVWDSIKVNGRGVDREIEPKSEPIDDVSHTPNPNPNPTPIATVVPHDDVADNNNAVIPILDNQVADNNNGNGNMMTSSCRKSLQRSSELVRVTNLAIDDEMYFERNL
ncbi:hypothetical protein Tco_0614655 [Tanacetum coccineum]